MFPWIISGSILQTSCHSSDTWRPPDEINLFDILSIAWLSCFPDETNLIWELLDDNCGSCSLYRTFFKTISDPDKNSYSVGQHSRCTFNSIAIYVLPYVMSKSWLSHVKVSLSYFIWLNIAWSHRLRMMGWRYRSRIKWSLGKIIPLSLTTKLLLTLGSW